jgi:hypothetical protein
MSCEVVPEGAAGYPPGRLPVQFFVDGQLVPIRLIDDSVEAACAAARQLKARFMFRSQLCPGVPGYIEWHCYDTRRMFRRAAKITPVRVFILSREDTKLDALVMWAMALSAAGEDNGQ